MVKSIVSILVSNLRKAGITHIFGIPGKAVVPLILEAEDQGIRFVLCRHESGAGFAAAGYALRKKTMGVAIGTSGPGATNLLTSAAQAKTYHAPVLFITGHPSMKNTGKAQGQDSTAFGTDVTKMFEPVTLFSSRIERADLLHTHLSHAVTKALQGPMGPVHLSIPLDVLTEKITPFELPAVDQASLLSPHIDKVVPLIRKSILPVVLLGKGVHLSNAYDEIKQFVEIYQLPVITTPGGKGTLPTDHPLNLGGFGLGGSSQADEYMLAGIDLLIVIGSKLSDMSLAGFTPKMQPKQVIHFDYEGTFMGKTIQVPTLGIRGDIRTNIKYILKESRIPSNFLKQVPMAEVAASVELEDQCAQMQTEPIQQNGVFMTSKAAILEMQKYIPKKTVFFADDGSHSFYAIKHLELSEGSAFYFDDVFGAMGHSISYALGAKLAAANENVVCITGDGCFMMHGAEISAAVNENVNITYIVFNNGCLDMVNKGMSHHLGRTDGTVFETPVDVKQFAESLGAKAFRCTNLQEVKSAIQDALHYFSCSVVELIVDPNEIPPTLKRG
ncbi:thiamine pyrophosphate-binding protein [Chengkuizengella axinellae]|uniref:Thiamine pyrophosphate-binding protein n=1 Tax=Chengkuizengella axinellae TaxID=3064388 RepID=A0ABT9J0Q6_9BACL|nr:thiamine pyrophosphate-binding protein [Chengkuizengella sp. 2205SS18-9]MDP5275200.1 thiamine pyrophosphate-binding protein [Chengkuizengella sp. 2205SS18-9]